MGSELIPLQQASSAHLRSKWLFISLTVCDISLQGLLSYLRADMSASHGPTSGLGSSRFTHFSHGTKLDILSTEFPELP